MSDNTKKNNGYASGHKKIYKGVIFDLDGTLLDTVEDLIFSLNSVLESRNLKTLAREEFNAVIGYGAKNLCRLAIEKSRTDFDDDYLDAFFEDYQKSYEENYKNKSKPYPGILELIEDLKKRDLSLNVLSNKPDNFTKELIKLHFGPASFDCVLGEAANFPRKPSPESTLHIVKESGLKASDFLFVGDGDTDVKTAAGAGVDFVGVSWGYRTVEELRSAGAQRIVYSVDELVDIF